MSITPGASRQEPAAPVPQPAAPPRRGWAAWGLLHLLPNALILAALVGLAVWGHHTGWKLPKLSELRGEAAAGKDDWCAEHSVPDSGCIECNASLSPRAKSPGWCNVHGVHECPFEHPRVAQLISAPTVTKAMLERAARALAFAERPLNTSKCKLHLRRIQFASEEVVARAGIEVTTVMEGPVTEGVTANGEIVYDQTRVARLSARVGGSLYRVDGAVGQPVKKDEVVALVDAAEVGKAKSELLQAVAQVAVRAKQLKQLDGARSRGAVSDAVYLAAEAGLEEAQVRQLAAEESLANLGLPIRGADLKGLTTEQVRGRTRYLGLPDDLAKGLDAKRATANLLPVRSPLSGVVVTRDVVAGEVVDTSKVLLVVADTSRMWLTLSARQEDARLVRAGQKVHFRSTSLAKDVTGTVGWVSTAVDEKTRTVKVRAELANPDGLLKANTFGTGRIVLREEPEAIVVPGEAVQWEGDCNVVFVRDKNYLAKGAPKVFHTRTVRPGAKDGANVEIIAGLLPGEVVATKGSGVLRAELLKNNLGAG